MLAPDFSKKVGCINYTDKKTGIGCIYKLIHICVYHYKMLRWIFSPGMIHFGPPILALWDILDITTPPPAGDCYIDTHKPEKYPPVIKCVSVILKLASGTE